MPHFAVLLHAAAAPMTSFVLVADDHVEAAGVVTFRRDGRVVHQVPAAWVARVENHPDDRGAQDAIRAYRAARVGGATIHVEESASAAPRRRGRGGAPTAVPAEGISVRIDEGTR